MSSLTVLETMRCRFRAEVRCIKKHIESLNRILGLPLDKFDGKKINIKFGSAIGYLTKKEDRGEDFYGFCMYLYDIDTITESTGQNTLVYVDEFRFHKVTFNTAENKRIDVKGFKESIRQEIARLQNRLKEYESDLRNWEHLEIRMEKKIQEIIDFKCNLNLELRSYFREQLQRI